MVAVWVRPKQPPDPNAIPFALGEHAGNDDTGTVLGGRYELIEVMASGGTAVVYSGRCLHTGGAVAVKVLYQTAKEAIGAFFAQEGRLAARIQNPHLVHARDFGEDDGRLFIVFDVVPGDALPELYFQELMPWRELLQVVLQVLDGLAALHAEGIVHRDVKPDNLIVAKTIGGGIHVTLLDLGFAAVPPARRITGAPEPTRDVYGTYGFIAPELLGGALPDPRNDLYSVGALMYLMLTAQQVPDISAAPDELLIPSPRAFVPSLPQAVDDIVMRALSDVAARYQDAEEMADAIRAALDAEQMIEHEPIVADAGEEVVMMPDAAIAVPIVNLPELASPVSASGATPSTSGVHDVAAEPLRRAEEKPVMGVATPVLWTRWAVAAALLLGALGGGGAVWLASQPGPLAPMAMDEGPSAFSIQSEPPARGDPLTPAVDQAPAQPATETKAEQTSPGPRKSSPRSSIPRGGTNPATPSSRVAGKATSSLLVSAVREPRSEPPPQERSAGKPSFSEAMKRLTEDVRACAASAYVDAATRPASISVRVRFDPASGSIDQVRVAKVGTNEPLAVCVERVVRAAAPPASDDPNETFTYSLEK